MHYKAYVVGGFVRDLLMDKDNYDIDIVIEGDGAKFAVDYAKNNDCEVIELTSYIDNENAHRFYENNNFIKHSYKFKQYLK